MRACSLNYRDLQVGRGLCDPKMPLPRVPFADGAGEVVAVGEGVTRFARGDRVSGIFMQGWISGERPPGAAATAVGGTIDGMLSEKVVLSEEGLVRVPDHPSFEEAPAALRHMQSGAHFGKVVVSFQDAGR